MLEFTLLGSVTTVQRSHHTPPPGHIYYWYKHMEWKKKKVTWQKLVAEKCQEAD
jgi:hypothetical protein